MRSGGFQGGFEATAPVITAEAIREQRADQVRKHQAVIAELEKKAKDLGERLLNLDREIEEAYKSRDERFRADEKAISLQRSQVDGREIRLGQDIEAFNREKAAWKAQNAKERAEIRALIDSNDSILEGIRAQRADMEALAKRVDDYGLRVSAKDGDLKAREDRLVQAQNLYEKNMGDLQALELRVRQQRQELKIELDTMTVQRATFAETQARLETLKKEAEEATAQAREDLAKLSEEKENLLIIQRKNTEQLNDIKNGLAKLADEDARLKTWERALSAKAGVLDTRERNIKEAEKGGKAT
jgi:chromosome segregation ATPase